MINLDQSLSPLVIEIQKKDGGTWLISIFNLPLILFLQYVVDDPIEEVQIFGTNSLGKFEEYNLYDIPVSQLAEILMRPQTKIKSIWIKLNNGLIIDSNGSDEIIITSRVRNGSETLFKKIFVDEKGRFQAYQKVEFSPKCYVLDHRGVSQFESLKSYLRYSSNNGQGTNGRRSQGN